MCCGWCLAHTRAPPPSKQSALASLNPQSYVQSSFENEFLSAHENLPALPAGRRNLQHIYPGRTLKEWEGEDGGWMYLIGFSNDRSVDVAGYFNLSEPLAKTNAFQSVKDYDLIFKNQP